MGRSMCDSPRCRGWGPRELRCQGGRTCERAESNEDRGVESPVTGGLAQFQCTKVCS